MAAGKYSFTIEQGSTLDFEIQYKDSNNNPVDLAGYQARMQIRENISSTSTISELSSSLGADGTGLNLSGSGGLSANKPVSSGSIGVYMSHATSSNLSFENAVYDLEIVSGSGNAAVVSRILEGSVKLSKEVTKGSVY